MKSLLVSEHYADRMTSHVRTEERKPGIEVEACGGSGQ